MIMLLTCLNCVYTHSYAFMYVCAHAHNTHIPAFHQITSFIQVSLSFVTPLGGTGISGKVSFLVLSRLLPDCALHYINLLNIHCCIASTKPNICPTKE